MTAENHDRIVGAMSWVMAGLGVAIVALTVFALTRPEEFQPVTYETGKIAVVSGEGVLIVPQVLDYDAPSVMSYAPVPLLMGRCSTHDEEFVATTDVWFQNTETGDKFFHSEDLTINIDPECTVIRVPLDIPTTLLSFIESEPNSPIVVSKWFVAGVVEAVRPGSVPVTWQTESFLIVNDSSLITGISTPADEGAQTDSVISPTEEG
jgi:hypothetical protein